MPTEPLFYLCAVPAVLFYGISKGGFGGSIAEPSVLLMTFVMEPTGAVVHYVKLVPYDSLDQLGTGTSPCLLS